MKLYISEVDMRRLSLLLIVLVFFLMNNSALGFAWTSGYYDHGATPFDANNNSSPIDYPYGIGYLPSPGYLAEGGEKFDQEGFFVAFDAEYMYVALTNSFGLSVTSVGTGTVFEQGDIFFGYGSAINAYAIDVSSGDLVSVRSWNPIDDAPGSYYHYSSIRERVGAFQVTDGSILGSANQILTYSPGLEIAPLFPDDTNGDTYVFEWQIDRSLLGWDGVSNISFHTTLGCGNDLIEYTYPGIPEPGTVILLGLGLVGAGIIARRKLG